MAGVGDMKTLWELQRALGRICVWLDVFIRGVGWEDASWELGQECDWPNTQERRVIAAAPPPFHRLGLQGCMAL